MTANLFLFAVLCSAAAVLAVEGCVLSDFDWLTVFFVLTAVVFVPASMLLWIAFCISLTLEHP